ncbi:MAG TPA: GNAT family N-acetyltransferase [Ktedonobacterales bacterium]|jgi:mycothiol synthase|nr:GNAT family N-acetyltransferase [Ktedonobacterales bacterium]
MAQGDNVTAPNEYSVRHARDQDARSILDLMAACDSSFGVESSGYTEVDVREGWANLDIERDTWAVIAPDGSLAAYGEITNQGSGKLIADGYVHPNHRGRGLGTALAQRMETRANELVASAPDGAQVTLFNGVLLVDQGARDLLERADYHVSRVFWEMRIEMSEEPAAPTLPAGLRMRDFVPGQDERAVFDTVEAAFADHWEHVPREFDEWLSRTRRPDFDPSLWRVIEADDGSIPAVALGWPRADHGWISTVATVRAWRKRGLAGSLLRDSFRAFWERGMRVVALGVDSQNPTGATHVYEAAGMRVAASAVIYQKVLRPGVDLATTPTQA